MGKSNKAKKEKNADFTKVKLKVGKKLPKGQNLTDTSFKSKKIVIGNQLKKHGNDTPVTKKKLSLKELLSHLQHFSAYVRQDGLTGLQELLAAHPELAADSLGQLLPALAALLVDEDQKLRTDTVTLVTQIVEQVSEQQVSPFFPVLVTHLTCAMTHIRPAVQQSSLPFLAVLLRRFPVPLSASVDLLLPTLLEQISRAAGGGRALLADPGSRLAAAGWRVTVLRQLARLLEAQPAGGGEGREEAVPRSVPVAEFCPVYPRWEAVEEGRLMAPCEGQQRRLLTEPERWREYSAGLATVMFQAYAEVAPDANKDGSLLGDEAADTLSAVLQVLGELLRHMEHLDNTKNTTLVSWFTETHWPDLQRHIFTPFPFSRLVGRRRKAPSNPAGPVGSGRPAGSGCPPELGSDAINALVCELAARLGGGDATREVRSGVLEYITAYLESDRCSELERVCRLLSSLLSPPEDLALQPAFSPSPDEGLERRPASPDEGLERRLACVRAAAARHARGESAGREEELMRLLAVIVTEPRFDAIARSEAVECWAVQLLPSALASSSDGSSSCPLRLLQLLRRMAAAGRARFVSALQTHAASLLTAAAAARGDIPWQRGVVELLYWPTDVAPDARAAYAEFMAADGVDETVKRYAREVLQEKYGARAPVEAAA